MLGIPGYADEHEQDMVAGMSETGRKALLVVTDQDRRGSTTAPFMKALEAGGITLIQRDFPSLDRLAELIVSMRKEIDCVILAGGDGMMSAGAIALRDSHLPLGILPLGPRAELARRLGLPADPDAAARIILDGHTRSLDLGSVNGRPFFSAASVGLTIQDSRMLGRATQSRLGWLGFAWRAFRVALHIHRFSCIIRCGVIVHRVRTIQVTVGNGNIYAGGMAVRPEPETHDPVLDVCSLEVGSRWDLLFMRDTFSMPDPADLPEIRIVRSQVVEVVTRLPLPITADGEIVTVTPARFSILPEAVQVYTPAPPTMKPEQT